MKAEPIETAPENQRVLVYGDHGEGKHDEMAMAWKDRLDGLWYYSPQGGLIQWRILQWMRVPEPDTPAWQHRVRGTKYAVRGDVRIQCPKDKPLQDDEIVLLYQDTDSDTYSARRSEEFHDGRFVRLEHEKSR